MWKRSENIVHRLFSRQVTSGRPNRNIHRAREFYENVVPSHTVYEVDCPDQWWRRFTNDGQYLICFSKTNQNLLIYRPLWPCYSTTLDAAHDLPPKFRKFENYFTLLHQIPLARGPNEVICKDFFLSTENNLYGIFATSTAADINAAVTNGAVPGVPCIEKITFLVVRLADGIVTGRSVFKDDYIHLAHNAGAFLHEDLLVVLSIRFQHIHILQVRDGGIFLDVRTIGDFCREDDELLLNSQSQAESNFQEEQRLQRKARRRVQGEEPFSSSSHASKAQRMKAWTSLIDRKRPRIHREIGSRASQDELGANGGDEIDILYDGYFRGLFTGGDGTPNSNGSARAQRGGENDHRHVRRFHSRAAGSGSYSNGTSHVDRFDRDHYNYETSSGRQQERLAGRQFARDYETSAGRRHGTNPSSSGSLYSSSGSDIASHSYTSTADLGSSDATTAHHELSSHGDEAGPSERWVRPVPSVSRSIVPPQNRPGHQEPDLGSLGDGPSREGGEQATVGTETFGDRQLGAGPSVVALGSGGLRGGRMQLDNAAAAATADAAQNGSQILRGLKQRLLSFILQGIQNDDTTPADKAQRLKRFYYHFQHYVDLVMWKVQFLDRYHLLIKFGSVDGVVLRNPEASHQTAFLAVYNMETTEILGFHQNSSEELLQLVERYWDYFRVSAQNPLYMNFISSSANNSFAREQFRKEKDACIAGKAGSYIQVIKRTLASLPHNSQSQSPSAYFDQYLFHYDEKLISSTDRHKPCAEHPIKFISRRRPNTLKFKINPGKLGSNDGHIKRVASFLFHPILPFAISVQQSILQTSVVNFHFKR